MRSLLNMEFAKSLFFFSLSFFILLVSKPTYDLILTTNQTVKDVSDESKKIRSSIDREIVLLNDTLTYTTNNGIDILNDFKNNSNHNMNDISEHLKFGLVEGQQTLRTYRLLPEKIENKFGNLFDCVENGYCYQNLITDTMLEVRDSAKNSSDASKEVVKLSETLSSSAVDFTKNVNDITSDFKIVSQTFATEIPKTTENVTKITDNINRLTKPAWYDRLLGGAVNGSLLYFNINRGRIK